MKNAPLNKANPPPSVSLGTAAVGYRGYISGINTSATQTSLTGHELERRLIEVGFIEGAFIEILHEGTFFRDPIAVRVGTATIALRRREAMAILIT